MQISERGVFLPGLMVGQRVIHYRVLGDFGNGDVARDVVQIGAVVLAHQEKLAAVAEHGGTDARLFETRILLDDGNVPAIELAKLCVAFLHDFLAAGDVEEAGDFLIHIPFPNGARERDDVLAGVIGDEKTGSGSQFLCRIGNVAQFKMSNLAGQRKIAHAVKQCAIIAIPTPRQKQRGDFDNLVALRAARVQRHQLLQHPVRRILVCFEIREADEDGGGTAFADYVWKPVVLIEMKKRGTDLQKHYRQAFDYWTRLVPNRPRYVVLCNFDEFRIYDFDTDLDTPKDTLALTDLPERYGPLEFLAPGNPKPNFENDRVAVTKEAADKLAECFRWMLRKDRQPQVERSVAQRFILQMLVALFAEDIDLLPKYFVTNLLEECTTPADSYELLGGLFKAMNQSKAASGGRYKEIPYFNGGLFANPAQIEIQGHELVLLRAAAKFNWNKVQPEVFGTLFQHSMADDERHAFGAHFTSPSDIMKIVKPTITDPWKEQIENAKTLKRLIELRDRLNQFRVLDPACGSGNFLYIAYRELKRIEARLIERMQEFPSRAEPGQRMLSFLSVQNFYGLDILPFAVELAKVTMMIGRKLAIDELHITEPALPLDNLDKNFIAADALLTSEGLPAQWPKADVIIGNPPFLGAKLIKPERGLDYVKNMRRSYSDVPGAADYCVYWIRKAHDHLPACTAADPVAGRAGLVGTQNRRRKNLSSKWISSLLSTTVGINVFTT